MQTALLKLPGGTTLLFFPGVFCLASAILFCSPLIASAGTVTAWGDNRYGQIGVPADLTNAVAISAGSYHNLALKSDGTVAAWGSDAVGETTVPTDLSNVVQVAAGMIFSLAVKSDGTVAAWGSAPTGWNTLTNIVAVAGGATHMLALKNDGTVLALGDDSYHQCDVPAGLSNVVAIAAGYWHSYALTSDGNVTAWGTSSGDHQLNAPRTGRAVDIASGTYQGVAVTADGVILPWGDDDFARVHGFSIYPPVWYPGAGTGDAAVIGSGEFHFLAASVNGGPIAWGWNDTGQCNIPAGLSNVVAMSGGTYHSIALVSDGSPQLANRRLGLSLLPASTVASSETVTLHVAAVGAAPLTYCWLFNGSNFLTTASPKLDLTNVQPAQAGTYSVIVSNSLGSLQGSNQVLSILPIKITDQPADQNIFEAADAGFAVAAVGTALNYQWRFNNVDLPNETNATLNLSVVATNRAGQYSVLVSNLYSSMLSSNAQLTVTLPAITVNPTDRTVNSGGSTTFTVAATGAPLNYQWLLNGTNLPSATNAVLTLNTVTTNDAGIYQALVSNAYRVLQSSNAQLDVVALTITQPTNRQVYSGDSTTFSVTAQGAGPFTYQWVFKGTNMPDFTNASFTLSNVTNSNAGNYSVIVGNSYGTVQSANASLTVLNNKPIITSQPASRGSYLGGGVSFQVAADGSKPLACQWLFKGTNIPSATNTTLLLTNLASINAGNYSVLVSNPVGSTLSSNALLTLVCVVTWGSTNSYGLGNIPTDLTNVMAIAAGYSHSVALKSNGRVVVWGDNYWGQTNVPANLSNVVAIAAGNNHTLAVKSNGTIVAWGSGGTNVPAGLTHVIAVAAGDYFSLALKTNGTVVAWGDGGYFGTATNVPANLSNVVAIAAGAAFSAALKADGGVVAWGSSPSTNGMTNVVAISANEFPLVALKANGTIVAASVTTPPASLSNVVAVAAGRYHALALKSDGTVTNWSVGSPVTPAGLSNVVVIASGQNHCLAIIGSGGGPQPAQMPFTNLKHISNSFSLSLPTQNGRVYWLEYKNSLSDTNWTALPMVAGNGGMLSLTNASTTNSHRFYRVRQW